ncbi:MAG: H-type lectin domain-containing protein [Planctomycetes bacterium]|nr:H-type lectin domain-containing protein [Planctomycetota bacterium]
MTGSDHHFVDIALNWSRGKSGTVAVLKRGADDTGWTEIGRTDASEFTATGLHPERSYTFAVVPVETDGSLAAEDEWETLRVAPTADEGTPALPVAPTGFAAAQDGPNVNLRWDAATDGVTVAHEARVGDSWEDGTRIAAGVTGTSLAWAWSASGATTLHLKAVDSLGRTSREAASATVTIAALDTHVTSDAADQGALGWPGTKTHLEVDGGVLRQERLPLHFGAAVAPFGSFAGVQCFAKYWPRGAYESPVFDAGQLEHQRVEVDMGAAQPVDAGLPFGAIRRPALGARAGRNEQLVPLRTPSFASQNSWRLTPLAPVDAAVEIDTSPTAGGAWDGWRPFAPGTYGYWRTRLRVTVTGDGLRFVRVPRLVVTRRKFNRKLEGEVVVNCSPVNVVFPVPFQNLPKVTASLVGYTGTPIVTNVTATGFTIAGGAAVFPGDPASFAPAVHWQAMGT